MSPICLTDTSGEFFLAYPGRLAVHLYSEGDLTDPGILKRTPCRKEWDEIQQDPNDPLALSVIEIGIPCRHCSGTGTYDGPCSNEGGGILRPAREDDYHTFPWSIQCPDCRGSGRGYDWTGCQLTLAQLTEWSDAAVERRTA